MVQVPEGEFSMGSDEYKDSQPIHTVYLDEFWIDKTEVNIGKYIRCVNEGVCDMPADGSFSRDSYYNDPAYYAHPVIYVDWNNAKAYCEWAGRRLPTEAEWEKAARGTDGRRYPWAGTDFSCELANYNPGSYSAGCGGVGDTMEVSFLPQGASPYGALNMVGNVAEWVADWYSATYYGESPVDNPTGPLTGEDHVLRGSSFRNIKLYLTTFYRRWSAPYGTGDDIGFRCASSDAP
jgi:formylglycine-generating enzyme required for sulfatase activity